MADNESLRYRNSMSIRLPAELQEAVKQAAKERGHSANWLIRKAIEDYLPRLIPADEVRLTK